MGTLFMWVGGFFVVGWLVIIALNVVAVSASAIVDSKDKRRH